MSELVDKGLRAKRESKYVDFKRSFDPSNKGEWCEILKDIVAMANSGGGVIMVGLGNGGKPSGMDVQPVLDIDDAVVVDKLKKYTGQDFPGVEIHEAEKQGYKVAAIVVSPAKIPLVFENVGSYDVGGGKQKTAFSRGTVYFRHGSKSEPGTTNDIRQVIERQLASIRSEWLDGVRKVVSAPEGSVVSVFQGDVTESRSPSAAPIRLVDDPDAPGYRLLSHDTAYPYRQKELIEVVNGMLPKGVEVNSHDILAVRRVHGIDSDRRFQYNSKYASPQYSEDFARWIVDQYKKDSRFFEKARQEYRKVRCDG